MTNLNMDYEANLFLYDLENRAKEHWFKKDEKWEIVIATAKEKIDFEKKYFPVVTLESSPPAVRAIAERVNDKLHPLKEQIYPLIKGNESVWLLAYNPVRVRT